MERRERNPELWIRSRYEDLYMQAVDSVANFVGSKPENLVLIENASSGELRKDISIIVLDINNEI